VIVLRNNLKIASINQILGTRARAMFRHRINFGSLPQATVEQMNDWCKQNCTGLWHSHHIYSLYWQFEDEKDATMFMLKWGS
jgi:hypothetical protein